MSFSGTTFPTRVDAVAAQPHLTLGQPIWRINPVLELHWKILGNSCVVLEAVSGETAVADALESAALACFEQSPQTLLQLTSALAADLQVEPDEGLQTQVSEVVQQFLASGWLQELESGE